MTRTLAISFALLLAMAVSPLAPALQAQAANPSAAQPAAQASSSEQAKALRNQGFSLMRDGRTAEALDAYRQSLRFEDDETVRGIVARLEARLAEEEAQSKADAAVQLPASAPPALASPDASAASGGAASPESDAASQARQLRRQAFALSSQGRTDEAAQLYRRSLEYEDSPQVRMILSRMEQAEVRKARAREQEAARAALARRHAPGMSAAQIRQTQQALAEQGYDPGPVDGVMGERSVAALRAFQRDHGLEQTGILDLRLAGSVLNAPAATASAPSSAATGVATGQTAAPSGVPAPSGGLVPSGGGAPTAQGTAIVSAPSASSSPAPASPAPASSGTAVATGSDSLPADCDQAETALTAELEQVMAQSESLGMCMTAKEYQRLMRKSAALLRRCPQLDTPDGAQAREYDRVAEETQQTIDASCI